MTARPSPALLAATPAAPLLTLLGVILLPATPDSAEGTLDIVAASSDRWLGATVVALVGQLLFVPAGLSIAQLLSSAGSRAGRVGGLLLATTGALHIGVLGFTLVELPLSEVGATAAVEAMFESPAFLVLIVPTLLTVYAGMVLAAVGLWRTRLTARWVPSALVVAPALEFAHDPLGTVATFVLWTAAFGEVARQAHAHPARASAPATRVVA